MEWLVCLQKTREEEGKMKQKGHKTPRLSPWSIYEKSGDTSVLFCVCAQRRGEPQRWPDGIKQVDGLLQTTPKLVQSLSLFVYFKPLMDPYLRQRGCGYVHVTPCCHRQQWRNVWPAPISLGTVSRGWAPSSSRILPPRGLVCQMAAREGGEGLLWACWGVQTWHFMFCVIVSVCGCVCIQ